MNQKATGINFKKLLGALRSTLMYIVHVELYTYILYSCLNFLTVHMNVEFLMCAKLKAVMVKKVKGCVCDVTHV